MQELETERWKSEAEKSGVKEKSARRMLENARIAAGDATRRSDFVARLLGNHEHRFTSTEVFLSSPRFCAHPVY